MSWSLGADFKEVNALMILCCLEGAPQGDFSLGWLNRSFHILK